MDIFKKKKSSVQEVPEDNPEKPLIDKLMSFKGKKQLNKKQLDTLYEELNLCDDCVSPFKGTEAKKDNVQICTRFCREHLYCNFMDDRTKLYMEKKGK